MLYLLPVLLWHFCVFKRQREVIRIPVSHHHSNFSGLHAGGFQQRFCLLYALSHYVFVAALLCHTLKKSGKIIGRDIQACRDIGYGKLLCQMFVYVMLCLCYDLMDILFLFAQKLEMNMRVTSHASSLSAQMRLFE